MHFLEKCIFLENSIFHLLNFFAVIEDVNTYLDVFVSNMQVHAPTCMSWCSNTFVLLMAIVSLNKSSGFLLYITPLVFFKTIIFFTIIKYLYLVNSTTMSQNCSMEKIKCQDFFNWFQPKKDVLISSKGAAAPCLTSIRNEVTDE